MAVFVSNFVAVANRVGHCKICLTSFDSLIPKNPLLDAQIFEISLTQAEL